VSNEEEATTKIKRRISWVNNEEEKKQQQIFVSNEA
jgi:hypothetical protein